jgi:hypothetical protein
MASRDERPIPVKRRSHRPFYFVAIASGALLWVGTMALSGRAEAWDSPLYWKAAYPLCLVLSGAMGYAAPERPWRWALAIMLVQPLVMMLTSGHSPNLLPLTVIVFAVMASPAIATARFGAWLRQRCEAEIDGHSP